MQNHKYLLVVSGFCLSHREMLSSCMCRDWPFEQCVSQRSKPSSLHQPEPFSFIHSLFSSSVLFSFKMSQRPFFFCLCLGSARLWGGSLSGSNPPDCIVPLEHKHHCQLPSLSIKSFLVDGCAAFFFSYSCRCHPHNPIITS